jgi:Ca-activated chloride channel homolog
MKASEVLRSKSSRPLLLVISLSLLSAAYAAEPQRLLLSRDGNPTGEFKGLVDVVISPGFDDAKVTVAVDGHKIADGVLAPFRIPIDFGLQPVEHRITVTAVTADKKRVQWQTTINKGHLPLTVKVKPHDFDNRVFEAAVTASDDDPITAVTLWDNGKVVATLDAPPYRFTLSPEQFAQQFVQVTAKTKSGEEAADFWSAGGEVHAQTLDVRTVPLFVSVTDRNGSTKDDIDASLFRIIDNGTEGKILEVTKAFQQPISIALLLDASSSMTFSMKKATQSAVTFVQRTLKEGDRCAVFSVRDTPRREVALTTDRAAIEAALSGIKPSGRTSLWDAIASAERELKDEKNRRAIVVLTDGGDTASITSFDEIDRLTKESGIPIYFIAYSADLSAVDPQEVSRLRYLAGETGGFVAEASSQNLQAKYGDIEKDLRAQYAILYQITDFAKRNQWRRVNVQLKSPQLVARTIRGYFAQ